MGMPWPAEMCGECHMLRGPIEVRTAGQWIRGPASVSEDVACSVVPQFNIADSFVVPDSVSLGLVRDCPWFV